MSSLSCSVHTSPLHMQTPAVIPFRRKVIQESRVVVVDLAEESPYAIVNSIDEA